MRRSVVFGLAGIAVVALAAMGGGYFLLRGDEPPPVSLAEALSNAGATTAVPAAGTATAVATAVEGAGTPASASSGGGSSSTTPDVADVATTGDLAGTWVVDTSASFVGYRIDEELASIGSTTAVGRTSAVDGSLEFDGSTITDVLVEADLTQLESDDSRRDGQLRRQSLETNTYPAATFVLVEPIEIGGEAAAGETITATAVGDLTLHGVTNRVSLDLEGKYEGGAVVVVGSTVVVLADYEIDPPRAMMVVSVADEATIEMQLVFRRA